MEKIMTDAAETLAVRSLDCGRGIVTPIPDLRWYVVHAYSGMRKAVECNIVERINRGWTAQANLAASWCLWKRLSKSKNGQKKTTERKFFPGYVLVEMIMDDETWHLVKHTNKVTGFVGGSQEPTGARSRKPRS
jgi:transcriptional antiterminator NusG